MTQLVFALFCAPFLLGVANRAKALFAGRAGPPLCQAYFDIWRLFHKSVVYSTTTTWLFRAGPVVSLAATFVALCLAPCGGAKAVFSFDGDFIVMVYLLGLSRAFIVLAALDTGSSFEGMGASRELQFSLLAEVGLLLCLFALAWKTGMLDASSICGQLTVEAWRQEAGVLSLLAAALLLVLLAESSRIPFDDPNTHLELTMIHEVMVLDHSGPELGMILYGASLKMWILGTFLVRLVFPLRTGNFAADLALFGGAMVLLAVGIGIIESTMARLRLLNVPKLLLGAAALPCLAFLLSAGG
ncbi:MAG: NADH-quinone oxidoreductase subunit H [Deltaproteobacteria bacterium]|nr:NADH-quinone oxidoreductase subunit H [Deltaproteobacteria bacterium]